jgi:hypothetical protein
MCFDFLYDLSEKFLILRGNERDIIINVYWSLCTVQYPLFLSSFNEPWIFSTDFSNNTQIANLIQPVQWEPNFSMRMDGATDDEANSHFLQFYEGV